VSDRVRLLLSLLSGGLLALAFPGTGDQGWLAFPALAPLLVAIEGTAWRQAASLGFAAGLVFSLATIPWIAPTMVRYGGLPWGLAGLVLLGLAGYLALYLAAFCALLSRGAFRSGGWSVVVAASVWTALEFLRTHLLTGFPWNLLGYSQHRNLLLIQIAAVTGVYGVSFVVVAVNAALAQVVQARGSWRGALPPVGVAALLWGLAVGSAWLQPLPEAATPPIRVALVQGNIDQGVKWDPAWQVRTLAIYRDLTRDAARERPQLVVWPEAAVPFVLREDPRRREVEALAREAGAYLLIGAPDRREGRARNSAFLMDPEGRTVGRYDKRHLVPFGEYVPLRRLLFFVNALAGGAIGEFVAGTEATVFPTPIGRVAVVICYEAIFPGEVQELFLAGADVLVNITNDAWFGRSAAPAQHLAMAAFRAVEHRAYLVRAANTGISAIVAPDGRVVRASGLFTPAVLSATISPRAGVSVYTRYGDLFAWGTVALALAAALGTLAPVGLLRWRAARRPVTANDPPPASARWGRRGLLLSVPLGASALVAAVAAALRSSPADGRGYREVARWRIPGGEGRFIAVGPEPTPEELRALGERLREEFRPMDDVVVMVFDDAEAAREVRRGSRVIGEARFEAALARQRAVYLKQSGRQEESLTIYDRYPGAPREVVRY
jgi:apolipoprotein N-acyltransferase